MNKEENYFEITTLQRPLNTMWLLKLNDAIDPDDHEAICESFREYLGTTTDPVLIMVPATLDLFEEEELDCSDDSLNAPLRSLIGDLQRYYHDRHGCSLGFVFEAENLLYKEMRIFGDKAKLFLTIDEAAAWLEQP